jgi:ABC-type Fe3+/spermidine/putrescine transport system ATPase subunit
MFGGKIHQLARPEEIYNRPADRAVADFIGASNLFEGRVVEVGREFVTLETPAGAIVCRTGFQPAIGQRAVALVRPEAMSLGPSADGIGFPGTVVARHFMGNLIDYDVALENGPATRVQTGGETQWHLGDPITVRIRSETAWLLQS